MLTTELAVCSGSTSRIVHERFPHGRKTMCGYTVGYTVGQVPAGWRRCRQCAEYMRCVR